VVRIAAALALVALAACSGDTPVVANRPEPFVYLVLNQRTSSVYGSLTQPRQHALLTVTGSPLESPGYLRADEFRMTRAADGARFAWSSYPRLSGEPGTVSRLALDAANYLLADSAGDAGLGAADLRALTAYDLYLATPGGVVRGRTSIPATFRLRLVEEGGRRTAYWPRVRGAAGYRVSLPEGDSRIQTDTSAVLGGDAGLLTVQALDPNLYGYVAGEPVARSGIEGGFGVFGSLTTAAVRIGG
jgi:hypothetical protein